MNISIIGPELSGKSTLAADIARRVARGRPVYVCGAERTRFQKIDISQWAAIQNAVVILDDANAFFDAYDLSRKENKPMKDAVFKNVHRGRVNIFVFHSLDDSVKLFYRQSKFVYFSKMYRDSSYVNDKFIRGIEPVEIGRKPYIFLGFQRY